MKVPDSKAIYCKLQLVQKTRGEIPHIKHKIAEMCF